VFVLAGAQPIGWHAFALEPIVGVSQCGLAGRAQAGEVVGERVRVEAHAGARRPAGIRRSAFAIGVEQPELLVEARDLGLRRWTCSCAAVDLIRRGTGRLVLERVEQIGDHR
jgi:hypothetical protein